VEKVSFDELASSATHSEHKNINMKKEYNFSKASRGSVAMAKGKTRITIYLDDDVIEAYKGKSVEVGRGYQALINDELRETLRKD
jgi:uncharacterized protein (DUF4415 family)